MVLGNAPLIWQQDWQTSAFRHKSQRKVISSHNPPKTQEGFKTMLTISKIEWKSWLKTQITKIMASSPITLWQRDREKMEIVTDFIFLGFKNHSGW